MRTRSAGGDGWGHRNSMTASKLTLQELFDCVRQLSGSEGVTEEKKKELIHMIDLAFSWQRRMLEESKERAMDVIRQHYLKVMDDLRVRVLSERSTTLKVAEHFERMVDDQRSQMRIEPMTGLLRFDTFKEKLEFCLSANRREKSHGLGVVDISDFKRVNDTFGHEVGDLVIKRVARLLRDGVRADEAILGKERRREPRSSSSDEEILGRWG